MISNDQAYQKLEAILNEKPWPQKYLFKFIVKSGQTDTIENIKKLFKNYDCEIKLNPSKNGNYSSISINAKMNDSKSIIDQYKKISKLKDVIML